MNEDILKNLSILVVDDEESICDIVTEELTLIGAHVDIAYSGKQAYEILNKKNYDYVITDIKMPNGNGMYLIKKIHQKLDYKPKIFICSGCHTLSKEEMKSFNIIKILEKPFSVNEFLKSISKEKLEK